MSSSALDGSRLFAQVARELASQSDLEHTTQRLVEIASQLTGCEVATVWDLSPAGRTTLKGVTNTQIGSALDAIITGVDEGLAHEALATRSTVHMRDAEAETRWPRYVAALRQKQLPIRSAVAYALELDDRPLGTLALYSTAPGYFTDELFDIGSILADHAAIALDRARAIAHTQHLHEALKSNRRIGIAIGILMALHRISEQQAFDMLRVASQNLHVKLRDVADEVLLTGATPTWQARRPA